MLGVASGVVPGVASGVGCSITCRVMWCGAQCKTWCGMWCGAQHHMQSDVVCGAQCKAWCGLWCGLKNIKCLITIPKLILGLLQKPSYANYKTGPFWKAKAFYFQINKYTLPYRLLFGGWQVSQKKT